MVLAVHKQLEIVFELLDLITKPIDLISFLEVELVAFSEHFNGFIL